MLRLLFCLLLTGFSSCYLVRGYRIRKFNLRDHEKLPYAGIIKSDKPYHFAEAKDKGGHEKLWTFLDSTLPNSYTAGFLILKNDTIIYEKYFNGFDSSSLLPSFSVAKSFVSTMVAIAIAEGRIGSAQDPITQYIPELLKTDGRYARITLQHLLDMRSGLQFDETAYGLKDDAVKLALRPNILKYALKVKIGREPGGPFVYQSINTEFLALAVERATGKKISAYLQEKLWQPLGAESNATWNVDSKKRKQEIAYAALNATARDFARLGLLFLHGGNWNGQQLIPAAWVATVSSPDTMEKYDGYKNQWWSNVVSKIFQDSLSAVRFRDGQKFATPVKRVNEKWFRVGYRSDAYHAEGILGQFIYVNPKNNVVIVRLGRYWRHPAGYADHFIYQLGASL